MKGLFLDDERIPQDVTWVDYPDNIEWTVVRTLRDFIVEMETDQYDYYSFDHDIQDFYFQPKGTLIARSVFGDIYSDEDEHGEHTGLGAAKALRDYLTLSLDCRPMKGCYVHSKNPIGKKNIENVLEDLWL